MISPSGDPHTWLTVSPQVEPSGHAPQASAPPHPSQMVPQYLSPLGAAQVDAVHTEGGPMHMPWSQSQPDLAQVLLQWTIPPQPSSMSPQY